MRNMQPVYTFRFKRWVRGLVWLGLGFPLVLFAKNPLVHSSIKKSVVSSKLARADAISDEALLEQARRYYEQGKLFLALKSYQQISDKSPLWITAQEEMAWTYYRMGDFESALSLTRTLTAFPINQLPVYESYLIKALAHMKLCQYSLVFDTLTDFQKTKARHILELEKRYSSENSQKIAFELQMATDVVKKLKLVKIDTEQRLLRDHRDGLLVRSATAFEKKDYNHLVFPDEWEEDPWLDELGHFEVKSSKCEDRRRKL
jgi:tetratricopeptide (TPR) repeat protein